MQSAALFGMLAFATAVAGAATQKPPGKGPDKGPGKGHNGMVPGSEASINNLRHRIKNVVLLCMENRSLDNLQGGQTLPGFENPIQNGPYCNPFNVSDPSQGQYCSQAKDFDSVADDPSHAVTGNNLEFFSTYNPVDGAIPNNQGFISEQIAGYGSKVTNHTELALQVMDYYTEEEVPVTTSLVKNFMSFNHWHSDCGCPTNPNRFYLVSGTSAGHGTNDDTFYTYTYTEKSIFQTLGEKGIPWLNYWDTNGGTGPEAKMFQWVADTNNQDKIVPMEQFYTDAASGSLPPFSYLNPSCCGVGTTSMHPSGLVSDGESFIKAIFEALRASKQWEETLFIITTDESGGFHDHVPAPYAPRPDDLTYTEKAANGLNYTYNFDRVGGRVPTYLISQWTPAAYVEQKGTNSDGETVSYTASSILRTLGYLWDFEPYNPRVKAAPSFDHLIGTVARDTIKTLPVPNNFTDFKL